LGYGPALALAWSSCIHRLQPFLLPCLVCCSVLLHLCTSSASLPILACNQQVSTFSTVSYILILHTANVWARSCSLNHACMLDTNANMRSRELVPHLKSPILLLPRSNSANLGNITKLPCQSLDTVTITSIIKHYKPSCQL